MCLALASIDALMIRLSYIAPFHVVNAGRYAVRVVNNPFASLNAFCDSFALSGRKMSVNRPIFQLISYLFVILAPHRESIQDGCHSIDVARWIYFYKTTATAIVIHLYC